MAALESLAGRVAQMSVPAESDIVRQGEDGDRFYVVKSGIADVIVDGFCVGSVTGGGYFGERALLRNVPRMATVRSREPMDLLVLPQVDFVTALTGQVGAGTAPAAAAAHRSRDLGAVAAPAGRGPLARQPVVPSRSELAATARRPERRRALARGSSDHPPGRAWRPVLRHARRPGLRLGGRRCDERAARRRPVRRDRPPARRAEARRCRRGQPSCDLEPASRRFRVGGPFSGDLRLSPGSASREAPAGTKRPKQGGRVPRLALERNEVTTPWRSLSWGSTNGTCPSTSSSSAQSPSATSPRLCRRFATASTSPRSSCSRPACAPRSTR